MGSLPIILQARGTIDEVFVNRRLCFSLVCDTMEPLPLIVEQRFPAAHVKTWNDTTSAELHVIVNACPRSALNDNLATAST